MSKYEHHQALVKELIAMYGSTYKVGTAMSLTPCSIQQWSKGTTRVPPHQAFRIQQLTDGKLKFKDFYPEWC